MLSLKERTGTTPQSNCKASQRALAYTSHQNTCGTKLWGRWVREGWKKTSDKGEYIDLGEVSWHQLKNRLSGKDPNTLCKHVSRKKHAEVKIYTEWGRYDRVPWKRGLKASKIGHARVNILNEAENPPEIYVLLEIPENIPFPKGVRNALLEAFSFLRSPVKCFSAAKN